VDACGAPIKTSIAALHQQVASTLRKRLEQPGAHGINMANLISVTTTKMKRHWTEKGRLQRSSARTLARKDLGSNRDRD